MGEARRDVEPAGRAAQVQAALAGDRRALARTLSLVEAGGAAAEDVLDAVYRQGAGAGSASRAHVTGITGPPGAGKSTLVGRLAAELRRRGARVAIVAVDPTSPFSGGALLGDRIRMAGLAGDRGVFIRSMATRGAPGGLAAQTAGVTAVLAASGFDAILLETVGTGQDDLAIAQEADTTVLVAAPGLGDAVQALKAGIVEAADVLVVNKADREGADRLVADLRFATGVRGTGAGWSPPVLETVATTGEGIPAVADALATHRQWLAASGAGAERAARLAERQILRWASAKVWRQVERRARATSRWPDLLREVAEKRLSPAAAADALLLDQGLPAPAASEDHRARY